MRTPQPFPYQGSKRGLAPSILRYLPKEIETLIEPFAGSAAITIAVAVANFAEKFIINDFNRPLIELWWEIINRPEKLAQRYELLWREQHEDRRQFYDKIREKFNIARQSDHLLYLLARCVKASVRYNANGEFNQSPDNRRNGIHPATMRKNLLGASALLRGYTECHSLDYKEIVMRAIPSDVIYMDPPYQGVCGERDPRYLKSIQFDEFVTVLEALNSRNISYLVSYDGRTGDKIHGRQLPSHLKLKLVELAAGRSTQATLLGRTEITYESLYLSHALSKRLEVGRHSSKKRAEQMSLLEA
jgi:DNA adenine methylase